MFFQGIGIIRNPIEVVTGDAAGSRSFDSAEGIITFASNIIRLSFVAAGIWTLFNIIMAGFTYVTSQGDPKALEGARNQITMSIIGLVIMTAAFIITGIISWVLFGDPRVILVPSVYGPGV